MPYRYFRYKRTGEIFQIWDPSEQELAQIKNVSPRRNFIDRIGSWTIYHLKHINWRYIAWYIVGMIAIATIIMWVLFKPKRDYAHFNKYRWNE